MMVLAVNISGDGASHADEAGTGNDERKKPQRKKSVDQTPEQHAGFDRHHTCLRIEIDNPVKRGHVERPADADCGVSVGTTVTPRYKTPRPSACKANIFDVPCRCHLRVDD